jgi:hypothetical protein
MRKTTMPMDTHRSWNQSHFTHLEAGSLAGRLGRAAHAPNMGLPSVAIGGRALTIRQPGGGQSLSVSILAPKRSSWQRSSYKVIDDKVI